MASDKRQRVLRIALLLGGLYALIGVRLFHVQVTTAAEFGRKQFALDRRSKHKVGTSQFERGRRGRIFDATGAPLALGYDTSCLMIDPNAEQPDTDPPRPRLEGRIRFASAVLDDLGVEHDLEAMIRRGTVIRRARANPKAGQPPFVTVRSRSLVPGLLPHERLYLREVMKRNRIHGFFFESEQGRQYPEGDLTAEIVGFLGECEDDPQLGPRGRGGVELMLDEVLAGTHGRFLCRKDGRGREIDADGYWERAPTDGLDVGLTLDVRIQNVVDRALAARKAELDCEAMTGIVIETRTGRILAMRSLPAFSAADLQAGRVAPGEARCRAITDRFPPGSTFKPFVMARAIEMGVVTWDTLLHTAGGRRVFHVGRASRPIRDSVTHGDLTARGTIVKSSNIGMVEVAHEKMGLDELYAALDSFEFRDTPGILLPGQVAGWYAPRKSARPISAGMSLAFGQEIVLSPLALASKFSIFGSGGTYHEPTIVDWVGSGDDRTENVRRSWRMVPEVIANEMLDALASVVEEGTAKQLRGMKWTAAAKSGTAQILDKSGPTHRYSSSLVALAPATAPRLTVYVSAHGLKGSVTYGGPVAGPAVRTILEETLTLLDEPSDRN